MRKDINAIGKACPMPVIMTKKEIDNGEENILTQVDNKIAVENLKKLATSTGFLVEVMEKDGIYHVALSKECEECNSMLEEIEKEKREKKEENIQKSDYVVFIGKNYIGEGSEELGENLMKMFLYTLTETKDLPTHVIFMNSGVKLPVLNEQAIVNLKKLEEMGITVLVCGACLNYYNLAEELKVGQVSNMYEIVEQMQYAGKVISF